VRVPSAARASGCSPEAFCLVRGRVGVECGHEFRRNTSSDYLEVLEAPDRECPAGKGNAAMTMMEHAPRQTAVKISPEGDKLITSGAHYLHMSKKDLVEAAVAFYLDARREEMQAGCVSC
jgi:hypothetical protein